MCGICGFTGSQDPAVIERMAQAVTHRGPDEQGFWSSTEISLGVRRLSIIDVVTGQQPVHNEDGSIWAVFNGEIYNHPELRTELEALGHQFRSNHSDSETLVHLYEEHGPDYVQHLNGMFAVALWDSRRSELHLARDRVGIKPLYFARFDGRVIFGSEIKSLLAHPSVRRSPNFAALHHYFSFKNIPAPWSAFEGIEQLRPGERVIVRGKQVERCRWWRINFAEDEEMCEADAAAALRDLLTDSVRLQMRSDVPFGAYLSGGVDSSVVVALMAQLGAHRVKTFSLTYGEEFPNKSEDRRFARQVSSMYDTEHHEYVLEPAEVAATLDAVLDSFDEPFSGVTSTYFLTQLIADHVKVALSGDGADELFGSYLPHRLAQPLHAYASLRSRRDALAAGTHNALAAYANALDTLEATYSRGDEAARRMSQLVWDEAGKHELYTDRMRALTAPANTEHLIRGLYAASNTADPLNRALFVDFETLLPDQVLAFVDRLSMAHSVEVRPPYLDHRLVEFAARLPGRMKIKSGRTKHLLKEAARGLIPNEIIERPKEGFILPINDWLSGPLRGLVREVLTPARLAHHGLLCAGRVQQIVDEHLTGRGAHGPRLWSLLVFQLWWERNFG